MHWIFDGIGTAIVVFILGLLGRRAYVRRSRQKQVQRAGDGATQIQSGHDTNIGRDE